MRFTNFWPLQYKKEFKIDAECQPPISTLQDEKKNIECL